MDAMGYFMKGVGLGNSRDYTTIIACYKEAIRLGIDPKYGTHDGGNVYERISWAYTWRGDDYQKSNKYDLAISDYVEALRFVPDDDSAKAHLGGAYFRRGKEYYQKEDYDKAISDFGEAVDALYNCEYNSNLPEIYYNRGMVYAKLNKFDLAISDFTEAITIDPKTNYYKERSKAYEAIGDNNHAKEDLWKSQGLCVYCGGKLGGSFSKKCKSCGKKHISIKQEHYINSEPSKKNKVALIILSILFGLIGVDRFYGGRIILGVVKLISLFILVGFLWWVIDIILACTGRQKDSKGYYIK